uniref:Uncharacterized protein n=1 Tax=Salix viminalis TaxID=40686 RepID=A0A6N2KVA4_SALVM
MILWVDMHIIVSRKDKFTNDGDEVVKFRQFIPSILNVARQCLSSGEEDVAIIAFEIFDELIESPAPLLGDSVKSIVQFSLEVCSSQNLESNTRYSDNFMAGKVQIQFPEKV